VNWFKWAEIGLIETKEGTIAGTALRDPALRSSLGISPDGMVHSETLCTLKAQGT
jgi:hypothetical protein